MRRYTRTSNIYEGAKFSFFFVEGAADAGLNSYVRERQRDIERMFCGECKFNIVSCGSEAYPIKELVLRRNPSIGERELEEKLASSCRAESRSRLLYVNDTCRDRRGNVEADIICEDCFGEGYAQRLDEFLKAVGLCRSELLSLPGVDKRSISGYNYKLPETQSIERDELLERDNIECLRHDLLAESVCGGEAAAERLSPIRFDNEFNISLPLYPQISIVLEPLPKALYILFLQHPEGIVLKNIQDYEKELREIYGKVSGRKNPSVVERMFKTLVNPTESPLHKNLSIIRRCFTSKLNYEIAKNYIPSHGRAQAHCIPIDAELVELPGIA